MNKFSLALILCFTFLTAGRGQILFDNPITGTNPGLTNPYTLGQTFDPNITVSGIGRGPGTNGESANDRYNASGWNSNDINLDDYFTFTLTPNAGRRINFSIFVYTGEKGTDGPTMFAFRSSADGFANNIGAATETGTTISLTAAPYQNITLGITFRFYAWNAKIPANQYSINDFTFNGTAALPIELLSFSGKVEKSTTQIFFSTATEVDNDYFSIERSPNSRDFSEIGQVKGAGTSYEPQDYIFTDERPLQGKNYYRLRQVDFDGRFSFSPVITATFGEAHQMTLAPLPATETLNIQFQTPSNEGGSWQVFDMSGRRLLSGEILAETVEQPVNIAKLPVGAYVLRLTVGQEVMVEQFRKN